MMYFHVEIFFCHDEVRIFPCLFSLHYLAMLVMSQRERVPVRVHSLSADIQSVPSCAHHTQALKNDTLPMPSETSTYEIHIPDRCEYCVLFDSKLH